MEPLPPPEFVVSVSELGSSCGLKNAAQSDPIAEDRAGQYAGWRIALRTKERRRMGVIAPSACHVLQAPGAIEYLRKGQRNGTSPGVLLSPFV